MSFDLSKTLSTIKGGLLDPENTWQTYLGENPPWQETALALTGPLILANVLLSLLFSRLIGGFSAYAYNAGWFISLAMAAFGFVVTVAVFNFLAGIFKGSPNFARAFAAVSLAAIPAWEAGAVSGLIPFLGFLLALAGSILTLVYLYRIMPLALNVPQDKRVLHYISALLLIFFINMIIGSVLGLGGAYGSRDHPTAGDYPGGAASSGMIGEIAHQGELMAAAGEDRYEPPADGKLDEEQVEAYVSVLRKTRSIQAEYEEQIEKLSADMEAKEDAGESISIADLRKAYSGVGSFMGANNAELEVVKSGGGNWAQHQWVKQQLRTARYQQGEGSDAIAHNYKLYQKYEEGLKDG